MLILIAESKTMTDCRSEISLEEFAGHTPGGEQTADSIMDSIRKIEINDLVSVSKLSRPMAVRLHEMAYDFPDKTHGARAVEAFTGVVFKAFGYDSLSDEARMYAHDNLRIVSSLYGWLRSDDIIKPYRLDYAMPLAPDDVPFSRFWKTEVTRCICAELAARNEKEVLDLLPSEAAKCFDWNVIRKSATVCKVDFRSIEEGGSLRTPHANLLKKARGRLLRLIAESGDSSIEGLKRLESSDLCYVESDVDSGHVVFAL